MPIGIIDSGVGGLTVMREIIKQLPNENLVYIGDNNNCPYGCKNKEEIINLTQNLIYFLLEKNVKMLVIACNTVTAVYLNEIKKKLNIPVIGVILSGTRAAISQTKNKKIAVIGTTATIKSKYYEKEIQKRLPKTTVYSLACPKFVDFIENNQEETILANKNIEKMLSKLIKKDFDTLILGCTHYPIIKEKIQNVVGKNINIVDPSMEIVREILVILDYYYLTNLDNNINKTLTFYTTGSTEQFDKKAKKILNGVNVRSIKVFFNTDA